MLLWGKVLILFILFAADVRDGVRAGSGLKRKARATTGDQNFFHKTILSSYDKDVSPDEGTVKVGLALARFEPFAGLNRVEFSGWLRLSWSDKRLSWANSAQNNAEDNVAAFIQVASEDIWLPEIVMYKSQEADDNIFQCVNTDASVYPDGVVVWNPPCKFSAICNKTQLWNNQNGKQTCFGKFGSWAIDGDTMGLALQNRSGGADLTGFRSTSAAHRWRVTGINATLSINYFLCCPEPYMEIDFGVEFERSRRHGHNGVTNLRIGNQSLAFKALALFFGVTLSASRAAAGRTNVLHIF